MIKKHEVKTCLERLYCDKCGAEMQCVSKTFAPKYRYLCHNCGEQVTVDEFYPREIKEEGNND